MNAEYSFKLFTSIVLLLNPNGLFDTAFTPCVHRVASIQSCLFKPIYLSTMEYTLFCGEFDQTCSIISIEHKFVTGDISLLKNTTENAYFDLIVDSVNFPHEQQNIHKLS